MPTTRKAISTNEKQPATDPEGVQWCRNLFACLSDNGQWGVPRSGLMFRKVGSNPVTNKLVLEERMPYIDELAKASDEGQNVPPNAQALWDFQTRDYALIAAYFRAAGIEVEDHTQPVSGKRPT